MKDLAEEGSRLKRSRLLSSLYIVRSCHIPLVIATCSGIHAVQKNNNNTPATERTQGPPAERRGGEEGKLVEPIKFDIFADEPTTGETKSFHESAALLLIRLKAAATRVIERIFVS